MWQCSLATSYKVSTKTSVAGDGDGEAGDVSDGHHPPVGNHFLVTFHVLGADVCMLRYVNWCEAWRWWRKAWSAVSERFPAGRRAHCAAGLCRGMLKQCCKGGKEGNVFCRGLICCCCKKSNASKIQCMPTPFSLRAAVSVFTICVHLCAVHLCAHIIYKAQRKLNVEVSEGIQRKMRQNTWLRN